MSGQESPTGGWPAGGPCAGHQAPADAGAARSASSRLADQIEDVAESGSWARICGRIRPPQPLALRLQSPRVQRHHTLGDPARDHERPDRVAGPRLVGRTVRDPHPDTTRSRYVRTRCHGTIWARALVTELTQPVAMQEPRTEGRDACRRDQPRRASVDEKPCPGAAILSTECVGLDRP